MRQNMDRIYLTKDEKAVLRSINTSSITPSSVALEPERFVIAVYSLKEKGLADVNGGVPYAKSAILLPKAKAYKAVNPELRNPFPWDPILKAATIIAAVSATAAFFVGCMRLMMAL